MKKLEEAGEDPHSLESSENYEQRAMAEQSIVIRMKDHDDFLGMFEYKKEMEQKIFNALIYGIKNKSQICDSK